MKTQEVSAPFMPVGRVSVGPVVCENAPNADEKIAVSGQRVSITLRRPDGEIEMFASWGENLAAAVADALKPLATRAFALDILRKDVTENSSDNFHFKVGVRVAKQLKGVFGIGHGAACDEPLACAVATLRALESAGLLKAQWRTSGSKEVHETGARMADRLLTMLGANDLPPEKRADFEATINDELNRFGAGQAVVARNAPDLDTLLTRFDPTCMIADSEGRFIGENIKTKLWYEWFPGLGNGTRTLGEVNDSLPAIPPTAVPFVVRLFENPQGWLKFRGAIPLKEHDIIHILLGRGLQDQDEAFVIGFTMGTTKNLTGLESAAFKFILSQVYPEPYRIPPNILPVFDLGVQAGKAMGPKNIFKLPLADYADRNLDDLRKELEIDVAFLKKLYRKEQELLPGTLASARLDVR